MPNRPELRRRLWVATVEKKIIDIIEKIDQYPLISK